MDYKELEAKDRVDSIQAHGELRIHILPVRNLCYDPAAISGTTSNSV
jgi:hypothetical protein